MSRTRTAIEAGKTALIVLLAASAIFLGWRTGLFNDFFRAMPFFGNVAELMRGGAASVETGGVAIKDAARPVCIVITNETGAHYGVKYDTDARNSVYDRTSSILNEALGSASQPQEVGVDEWRAALSGPGVFFSYIAPVGISVLDGWLGTRNPVFSEEVSVRHICVAFGEDKSRIYFQDHESGLFFGADTASSAGKAQELEVYVPNDAVFAFETGIRAAESTPCAVLFPGSEHPDVQAVPSGTAEELLDAALTALGHIDETYTIQPESDGAFQCIGTQFNIMADARGRVQYRSRESLPPVEERPVLSEGDLIERARVIVEGTVGAKCGNAEVFFESIEHSGGYSSVCFSYYIAGGRVYLNDDANAAKVNFVSGTVMDIELNFRSFTLTGDYTSLIPERQALAAAGGEFILCYYGAGTESMQPFWH